MSRPCRVEDRPPDSRNTTQTFFWRTTKNFTPFPVPHRDRARALFGAAPFYRQKASGHVSSVSVRVLLETLTLLTLFADALTVRKLTFADDLLTLTLFADAEGDRLERPMLSKTNNRQLEADAYEIRLRAERRAGELLGEMEKHSGGRPEKTGSEPRPVSTPKLSDLGVTKSQSSRWQRLADLPDEQFEAKVDRAKRKAVSVVDGTAKLRSGKPHAVALDLDLPRCQQMFL
jgi:hypothetical protein